MPAEPTPDDVKTVAVAREIVDRPVRRNPPWRPTTLTVRKFLKICHLVEQGAAITRACEVECISYARFRFRVSNSPRLQERLKEAEKTRFDRRHEEALESIMEAGQRSWMAHAWFLERTLAHLYSQRPFCRPSGDDRPAEEEIPAEVLARHRALLLEQAREAEARQAANRSSELAG